jgi:hypothetical protein
MSDDQKVAIVDPRGRALERTDYSGDPTPGALIKVALEHGASIEQMRALLELKREMERDEARRAFTAAIAAFKRAPPQLIRDELIAMGPLKGKRFTSLGTIVAAATPALAAHGLSADWEIEQANGQIRVTSVLTHVLGHEKRCSARCRTGPQRDPGDRVDRDLPRTLHAQG